ncbi:MAG TPA: hypothetical protein VMS93_03505, partial [Candidatus Saccharimonadales bacterium]|nr:hypothetical protein [Candidatus Saccharimonadales bacterium]
MPRIVPALLVVALASLAFAAVALGDEEYCAVAKISYPDHILINPGGGPDYVVTVSIWDDRYPHSCQYMPAVNAAVTLNFGSCGVVLCSQQ